MPHLKAKSGIEWHYDVAGEGEHLLFLHGWGVDQRIWRQQSKFFSQYYRIMTVDLPGHGQSSWKKVALETMVQDLNVLLKTEQFDQVTIIGSSIGGLIALKLYEKFPEEVRRMIFVGSMPKFSKSKDYPHGLDIGKMRALGEHLKTDYPSIVNIFFRSLFTRQERQTRRFKWIQKFRRDERMPMKQALLEYLDIMEREDLREVLQRVRVPVQFINGREDEICNKETVAFLKKLSPASRFDFFEQCGHFPFLSKPYEFNQVMEEFLKESTL
jgi:pimeloyl-[acyl-carrier protein] methyl ester esterase